MSQSNSETNNRLSFVDQCKGIGIILMVYGHCTTEDFLKNNIGAQLFASWFTSFHMPIFFIIGGLLLAYKHETFIFPKTLIKKAKGLLLPGLYFSCISILISFLLKLLSGHSDIQYLYKGIIEFFVLKFPDAMWFLPCYFFAEIIFLLLIKISAKSMPYVLCVTTFAISVFINPLSGIFVRLSRVMMAICFVCIGWLFYQLVLQKILFKNSPTNKMSKFNSIVLKNALLFGVGLLLLVIDAVGSYFNGSVSCAEANFGVNPFLFIIDAIFGSLGIIFICVAINKIITPLEFYGKNSLIVLCTHMILINLFWVLNGKFIHLELGSVNAVVFALCILLFEIPLIIVINRFLPFLIGRKRNI